MAKKPYSPMASYEKLKTVEGAILSAETADELAAICKKHGASVGYKAFCYMLTGKMTPEGMKANEACEAAQNLPSEKAQEIYKRVLAVYPEHPLALENAN